MAVAKEPKRKTTKPAAPAPKKGKTPATKTPRAAAKPPAKGKAPPPKVPAKAKKAPTKTAAPKGNPGNLPAQKETHKLTPAALQAILDMTLAGYRIGDIQKFVKEAFGVSVHTNTIVYHRRIHRDKLMVTIEDEIAAVRSMYPESAILSGRIGMLDGAVKKEIKKRRSSAYGVASLVAAIDTAMYRAEMIKLKYMEFQRKYPEHGEDEAERILREIEKRSHVIRNVTEGIDAMAEAAGSDFAPEAADAVVAGVELIEEAPVAPPVLEGIGEDALLG